MIFGITWGEIEIMCILLPIDAFNLYLLVRLWKWSQTAGRKLIGDVIKRLNLEYTNIDGQKEKISSSLSDVINSERAAPIINEMGEKLAQQGVNLDLSSIIQGVLTGQISRDELIQYAPMVLKVLNGTPSNNESSSSNGGRW